MEGKQRPPITITQDEFDEICLKVNPVSALFTKVEAHFYGLRPDGVNDAREHSGD